MVFIPHEAQETIQNLEKEVKRLSGANQQLKKTMNEKKPESSGNWGYFFVVLFILALGYIAYNHFYGAPITAQEEAVAERDSLTIYMDDEIKKYHKGVQGDIVYRVQLGAFEEFTLEQYDASLDAIEEVTINGMTKITLGAFTRLQDAQDFQQHMVNMGIDKCYIVAFQNETELGTTEPLAE